MEPDQKKVLRPLCLELRHLLEGYYDGDGAWHGGDLEQRLASLGVWWERDPMPLEKLPNLSTEDRRARELVDAYLALRAEAGVPRRQAVEEFVRETAYTWATRLLLLRCMEARGLIDEVVVAKEVYGGRSLAQMRLCREQPAICTGDDGGLFATFGAAFAEHARRLPEVFDPAAPGVALRPSTAALQRCVALLSGTAAVTVRQTADDAVFAAPDALGWAYQYWNAEEKDRVFERVRTVKGAKITGAEIVPATQLYTEPYMVKFLVQNSLGAYWQQLHPDSELADGWEYYVRDADRAPVKAKNVESMTFLDPACGSGHFLLEAFDLFYAMYLAEGKVTEPEQVCRRILERNLYGIDIDERAVQIARAALWMKAAEKVQGYRFAPRNLVATNLRLPPGKDHLETFLAVHPDDAPLADALKAVLDGLAHADELGSLVQIEEPVRRAFAALKTTRQTTFAAHGGDGGSWYTPPKTLEEWDAWQGNVVARLADHFATEAERATPVEAFFSRSAAQGLKLFDLLSRRYDVVATNPPYMGSGNMGQRLKSFLEQSYPIASRDLFAAFLIRCNRLIKIGGYVAIVTQRSYLNNEDYDDLRGYILTNCKITNLVDLGTKAFQDTKGEKVSVALSITTNIKKMNYLIDIIDLREFESAIEKQKALINPGLGKRYKISPNLFLYIPGSRMTYDTPQEILELFTNASWNSNDPAPFAIAYRGLDTCDVGRWVRYWWEISPQHLSINGKNRKYGDWVFHIRGADGVRWFGNIIHVVKWGIDGEFLKSYGNAIIPNESQYFTEGVTFSRIGTRGLFGRYFTHSTLISDSGSGIIPVNTNVYELIGLINSTIVSTLLRVIDPSYNYQTGHINKLPKPRHQLPEKSWKEIADPIIQASLGIRKPIPFESEFSPHNLSTKSLTGNISDLIRQRIINEIIINYGYQVADSNALSEYFPKSIDQDMIWEKIGVNPVKYRLISGFEDLCDYGNILVTSTGVRLSYIDKEKNGEYIDRVRQLFIKYPESIDRADDIDVGADNGSVPSFVKKYWKDGIIADISNSTGIHPISVGCIILNGLKEWRNQTLEQEYVQYLISSIILQLLGHRWPKQVEAGEPVPDWADPDGIIPLVADGGGKTLLELVRERLVADGETVPAAERYFEEVMGMLLGEWLSTAFFKHHVKQFRKRPVAWQLQSGPFTRRSTPAFACLVYCQAIDGDVLHKVRTRYVGELRKRCETELRDIEGLTLRTEAQDRRARELSDRLAELKAFDAKLAEVAERGFASAALEKIAKKEPLDRWCSPDGVRPAPATLEAFLQQEQAYVPDVNDGVRVNVAPLQKAGLLAGDVIAKKDVERAISDRAEWRADERRWCRGGKLPKCGWW